jgi:hypothetical protein
MSEAKPDSSGSTGEFRAFVERGGVEPARRAVLSRAVLSRPVGITLAALAVVVVVVLVLAVR